MKFEIEYKKNQGNAFENRLPQSPGPRLNIRKDVFSQDLVKSRSHEIGTLNCHIALKFDSWQAHRQQCCRSACQISERSDNSKYKSRGFETLREPFGYWDGAPMAVSLAVGYGTCNSWYRTFGTGQGWCALNIAWGLPQSQWIVVSETGPNFHPF